MVPKSFYRADEIVYLALTIDNSQVNERCSLIVRQKVSDIFEPSCEHSLHELKFPIAHAFEPTKTIFL